MHQVIRRMPGSHQSGTTVRHARGVIGVRRVWAHDCGAEAVEALALVAVLIALLALLTLVVRDQAAAIGGAATATLARWLTGVPGAVPVGGTGGITPLTVTAPLYTVVSVPQLLMQTTDAAPWVTWGIGIAGSLLSAAAARQTTTSRALSADAGAWLRPVGAALTWLIRQGAGLVSRALSADAGAWLRPVGAALTWLIRQGAGLIIGFGEGVYDTIAGLVTLVVDVVKLIAGDEATRRKYGALLEALARDPLGTLAGIFEAIIAPIVTDWQAGRYGEAAGRTVFELLPAILSIFTGGAGAAGYAAKAGSVGKTADALADAGRIVSHVDDIGRIAGRVDDAARGVDALADAGRIARRVQTADALTDAGRIARRVQTADALTDAGWIAGQADDAGRIAKRVDVGEAAGRISHADRSRRTARTAGPVADTFESTLNGKVVTLRNVSVRKIRYVKRAREELQRLRSEFNRGVRREFLIDLANDPRKVTELQKAGLSDIDIARMRAGKVPDGWEVHHKLPLDDGGENTFENLVLIKTDPHHKAITNWQNKVARGIKEGEFKEVDWPYIEGFVYPKKP